MRKKMAMLLFLVFLAGMLTPCLTSYSEEADLRPVYSLAELLNGRRAPKKSAKDIAWFLYGSEIERTGRWSQDHCWVEVYGGEDGVCWVNVNYISERMECFEVCNENNDTVKIREHPGAGRVKGYARHGDKLLITQVIGCYGRCDRGWVDLDYFVEEVETNDYQQ